MLNKVPSNELSETVKELKDERALGSIGIELGLNKLVRFLPVSLVYNAQIDTALYHACPDIDHD